jgi:hypothetical protein
VVGVLYLLAIALGAFFVAAGFTNATPPGGVAWPYFVVLLLVPFASYRFAVRLSVAICYGFACGLLFAWPVFIDSRTGLSLDYGVEPRAGLLAKITLFAVAISALSAVSYGFSWQRRLTRRCSWFRG